MCNYFKALSVSNLIALLKEMPDDYVLTPNDVGNLMVLKKIDDERMAYAGYIEFIGKGRFVISDEDD